MKYSVDITAINPFDNDSLGHRRISADSMAEVIRQLQAIDDLDGHVCVGAAGSCLVIGFYCGGNLYSMKDDSNRIFEYQIDKDHLYTPYRRVKVTEDKP